MARNGWLAVVAVIAIIVLLYSFGDLNGLGGSHTHTVGSVEVGAAATGAPALPALPPASTPPGGSLSTGPSSGGSSSGGSSAETAPTPQVSAADVYAQTAGTVAAGGTQLLPLSGATKVRSGGSLSAYSGERAVARSVQVQSVAADEGFWIGPSSGDRIWVQLTGPPPESPYTVKAGDRVSFVGKVAANGIGFAARVGVNRSEGEARLNAQGQHIDVVKETLVLAAP
jgi:hypothetical protein